MDADGFMANVLQKNDVISLQIFFNFRVSFPGAGLSGSREMITSCQFLSLQSRTQLNLCVENAALKNLTEE